MVETEVDIWQVVDANDPIGTAGMTSTFNEQEVYFELRHEGLPLDPAAWFEFGDFFEENVSQ